MVKAKEKKGAKKFLRYFSFSLATIVLIGICCAAICGVAFAYYINKYVSPQIDVNLDSFRLNFTSFIYYTDSKTGELKELEKLHGAENRVWVDIDDIPDMLQQAFLSVEDAQFESHNGINWKRTIGATINYIIPFRSNFGGGSTITQQLIKNLTGDKETSPKRKIQEIMRALELEKNYDKDDILEMYLNKIYFGQGAYGVKQAAYTYFGKELNELTLAECAAIAGITKNPYKYDIFRFPEYNAERRKIVLGEMLRYGVIDQAQFDQAVAEEIAVIKQEDRNQNEGYQSYFVDAVIDSVLDALVEEKGYSLETAKQLLYGGGLKIISTIDLDVQKAMDEVFLNTGSFPGIMGKDGTMPQASMVIMDPYTGYVKALYGGRGPKPGDRVLNRATQTKRSAGSAIKPLTVYAPAIEHDIITPITVIDDVPKDFELRSGGWPKNESNSFSGLVTVSTGIAKSLNTVAVDIVNRLTPEKSFDFAHNRLNLTSLVKSREVTRKDGSKEIVSDVMISPMALGGLTDGVSVLEMTAAYGSFVNDGIYSEPVLFTAVYDAFGDLLLENTPQQTVAMESKTATYMIELMKGVVSFGTGTQAALGGGIEVGGKTGTTQSNNDRWFAGITPYYTGVVWFGYDKQQEITGVSMNPALYLWKEVMKRVHTGLPAKKLPEKTELVEVTYCLDSGLIPNAYCSQDERGSRVATARVAKEDVPKETCGCHVMVEVCGETGLPSNAFCPIGSLKEIVRVYVDTRSFPVPVKVGDEAYCIYPDSVCKVHNMENDGNAVPVIPDEPVVPPDEPGLPPDEPDEGELPDDGEYVPVTDIPHIP